MKINFLILYEEILLRAERKPFFLFLVYFLNENVFFLNFIEEYHDDGETYAGNRVLTLLKTLDAKNVVVVVTRWFGGQLLGPVRFEHILKCSREVLDKGSLINTSRSSTNIKRVGYSTNSIIVNACQVCILLFPIKEFP